MHSAHYVPRIIETFTVVNRYIRLTFRRVYYKCVNAAVLREIELYMSRKARSAESYRAGSSDGLYQVIVSFDLWRCKLRLLHKPVVFDNDGLRHNTLSGSDFLYRRNLTRHGRVHGCAYVLIGIAYYLTYKNSVADLYRWRTRRADMLAHRKRDRLTCISLVCFSCETLIPPLTFFTGFIISERIHLPPFTALSIL